ncbi:TolB-like translocation protein [Pontimicrobium aquaticum]|uniref:PD40 domain-containing protein n=1 Tax=Pontimicrobium aquaticum TaxID=2565367 RepID=UPI001B7FB9F3|nr:PD40 domain-containing protein [Pontimicrobium aquaticum]
MVVVQYKNDRWTESIIAPKSGEPFISPDGKTMHLGKTYRQRTTSGWSEVKHLDAPFKDFRIMCLTASSNGTYYFDEASETGPLRYSRLINGIYEKPKTVEIKDIGNWNAHPFIAPDESYIIWDDQRENGYGSSDLYISFRQEDDSWEPSINLGDKINTEFEDAYGSVSPDGKYFFFHRSYGGDKADIFWVDAQFIEVLKPK